MKPFCVAIDWGTSQFRLWILDAAGEILDERRSDEGMLHAGEAGFSATLERHLGDLGTPSFLPAIVCGMAGSRQGWQEARYLDVPVDVRAITESAVTVPGIDRDVRILPGIAQRDREHPDVMRGEETQLLGLLSKHSGSGLICVPGTHSKWITLRGGQVESFFTCMTGELFSILSKKSVLRFAGDDGRNTDPQSEAFLNAVDQAVREPRQFSNQLFALRSAHLLGYTAGSDSISALSGSLIGMEIAAGRSKYGDISDVTILASDELGKLYRSAMNHCGMQTKFHDSKIAARAGLFAAAKQFWHIEREKIKA